MYDAFSGFKTSTSCGLINQGFIKLYFKTAIGK